MRIIVAGSRSFNDYKLLKETLDRMTKNIDKKKLVIILGGADGADKLADRWAFENLVVREIYRPDYKNNKPTVAPIIRNTEMIDSPADALIAFWDGESKGTKDIISKAKRKKLKIKIVYF